MSRVFVVQEPIPNKHNWVPDLSSARKFGKLTFVFRKEDQVFADPTAALFIAQEALEDFNPAEDCLLWPNACDHCALVVFMLALRSKQLNNLSILHWDRGYHRGVRSSQHGYYSKLDIQVSSAFTN